MLVYEDRAPLSGSGSFPEGMSRFAMDPDV